MITPFSGLSLIVHLTIIGISKIINLFRRADKDSMKFKEARTQTSARRIANNALSVLVITVIATLMMFSFGVALETGIREGSNEPHIEYLWQEYEYLRDSRQHMLSNVMEIISVNKYK